MSQRPKRPELSIEPHRHDLAQRHRQFGAARVGLRQRGHAFAGRHRSGAEHLDAARGELGEAEQSPQESRLARTVRADERDGAACLNVEVEAGNAAATGVAEGGVPKRNGELIGYRCAAEPEKDYVAKGGKIEDTVGRKCLCNALMANIGHGQVQKGNELELPVVTAGDDVAVVRELVNLHGPRYTAENVLDFILAGVDDGGDKAAT